MSFHEIRFPAKLSFGSLGGPERLTEIVTLANGFEERNTPWADSRRRYDAGMGVRWLEDIDALIAFFEARRGRLFGFRWKDWSDYRSSGALREPDQADQVLGTGDGETQVFQLVKTYRSGEEVYRREVRKPVAGTVRVSLQGDVLRDGVDFTVDTTTGEIAFAAPPPPDATVTAGFEFDVPVRFDTDSLQTSVVSVKAGDVPSVPIVEIRL